MKKIIAATALAFMFAFGYTGKSMEDHLTRVSEGVSNFSTLIGKTVKNFQGDDLGTISEFVKGPEGTPVSFATSFPADSFLKSSR